MRRTRLRAGLLLVVLLALGGIGWQVWRRVTTVTPKALEQLGAELVTIDGCGHLASIERPAEVTAALRRLLRRATSGPR